MILFAVLPVVHIVGMVVDCLIELVGEIAEGLAIGVIVEMAGALAMVVVVEMAMVPLPPRWSKRST